MLLMSSVMDSSLQIAKCGYHLRHCHHWSRPVTPAMTATTMASTHQISSSSLTLSHNASVAPRIVNDARHSFVTNPLGSSATIITTLHDCLLVAGESGTGYPGMSMSEAIESPHTCQPGRVLRANNSR